MGRSLVAGLIDAVGADAVLTGTEDLAHYGTDRAHGQLAARPAAIVRVGSILEVQRVVRLCAEHDVPIVPSGGRTGLCGGATATANEVVVSLERMSRVLELDAVGRTLRCEAGATVQSVRDAAQARGLMYPVAFSAQGSAQIGGTIATNAGGVHVVRYGTTRRWVMGVRAVVASGDVLELGGPLVKDNTGYDLKQLFIGAEGTLGLIVEATLQLCRPPAGTVLALCAVPHDAAILEVLSGVEHAGLRIHAIECFDRASLAHVIARRDAAGPFGGDSAQHVLVELEVEPDLAAEDGVRDRLTATLEQLQGAGAVTDAVIAASAKQSAELWSLRHDISDAIHPLAPLKLDISVPVAAVPDCVAAIRAYVERELPEVECVIFGHVGDGNLHVNLIDPRSWSAVGGADQAQVQRSIYGLVGERGGSISAEHGIGLLKRDYLGHRHDATTLAAMRAVKNALDPKGLFNPGKVLPD